MRPVTILGDCSNGIQSDKKDNPSGDEFWRRFANELDTLSQLEL